MCMRERGGGREREREREREEGGRQRERERFFDSLILYLNDDGFRLWPNQPTGPR